MFTAIRHARHNYKHSLSTRRHFPGRQALHVERLEDRRMFAACHGIRGDSCLLSPNPVDLIEPASLAAAGTAVRNVDAATNSPTPDASNLERQNTAAIDHVFANESDFLGGVSVAAGDVNGDGAAVVITGAANTTPGTSGNGVPTAPATTPRPSFQTEGPIIAQALFQRLAPRAPQVPQLPGRNLDLYIDTTINARTMPVAPLSQDSFTGGVMVATGDVNGDGLDDVITAAGPGGDCLVDDLKDQGTSSVFSRPAPANAAIGATATGTGNVQIQASLSSGAIRRIEELLQNIDVLQREKDSLGFFSDPMGGKRKSLQDQIDKKFAEINRIRAGKP